MARMIIRSTGPVDIRRCVVADLEGAPKIGELLAEYAAESATPGLGQQDPQWSTYYAMEKVGVLRVIGAFVGSRLVGFMIIIFAPLPHYGKLAGSTESYFVTASSRNSGAGLRLLREAELMGQELGVAGFFVSSPTEGRLAGVLPHVGYTQTNSVFFKSFA